MSGIRNGEVLDLRNSSNDYFMSDLFIALREPNLDSFFGNLKDSTLLHHNDKKADSDDVSVGA